MVTEPGAVKVLAEQKDQAALEAIERGVRASVRFHESRGIAVVAHHDCSANSADYLGQIDQTRLAVNQIKRRFPETTVLGLWVDERGRVGLVPEALAEH